MRAPQCCSLWWGSDRHGWYSVDGELHNEQQGWTNLDSMTTLLFASWLDAAGKHGSTAPRTPSHCTAQNNWVRQRRNSLPVCRKYCEWGNIADITIGRHSARSPIALMISFPQQINSRGKKGGRTSEIKRFKDPSAKCNVWTLCVFWLGETIWKKTDLWGNWENWNND